MHPADAWHGNIGEHVPANMILIRNQQTSFRGMQNWITWDIYKRNYNTKLLLLSICILYTYYHTSNLQEK